MSANTRVQMKVEPDRGRFIERIEAQCVFRFVSISRDGTRRNAIRTRLIVFSQRFNLQVAVVFHPGISPNLL